MGWPEALVAAIVIFSASMGFIAVAAGRSTVRAEEAKGKNGEQYRVLAAEYETLAKETRDAAKAMQADLAELREKVGSIEHMLQEVG